VTSKWRVSDFYFIVPSLRVLNAGWLLALIAWARSRIWPARRFEELPKNLGPLFFVAIAGVLLNVLITWDMHIIHHNSYLSILALDVALAIVVSGSPGAWKIALTVAQFTYFLVVWVVGPIATANRVNISFLIGLSVVLGAFWYSSNLVGGEESEEPLVAEKRAVEYVKKARG
jgi:hypothetical protein